MKSFSVRLIALLVIATTIVSIAGEADARKRKCGWRYPGRCRHVRVPRIPRIPPVLAAPLTAPIDVVRERPIGTTADDMTRAGEVAVRDTVREAGRAGENTRAETLRAGRNVGVAGAAIVRYVERQFQGAGTTLAQTQRRLRSGQLADAFWHIGTDSFRTQERGLAEAMQASSILRTAGAVAATTYGGPGGAAAFAAWYAYRQTGNLEIAIRAGLLAGVTSAAGGEISEMSGNTIGEVAKKAILAGAVGGAAVAAAGGDQQALQEGFLRAGGMILIQEGYRASVGQSLDTSPSIGEPYCMATVDADCSPNIDAYIRDENGNVLYDENGLPRVDITRTDLRRPHVGRWGAEGDTSLGTEASPAMVAVSRIPGMNAMAVFHDNWSVSWDMGAFTNVATIVPAVVLTYYGTDAPTTNLVTDIAIEQGREESDDARTPSPGVGDAPQPQTQSQPPRSD